MEGRLSLALSPFAHKERRWGERRRYENIDTCTITEEEGGSLKGGTKEVKFPAARAAEKSGFFRGHRRKEKSSPWKKENECSGADLERSSDELFVSGAAGGKGPTPEKGQLHHSPLHH